MKTVLPITMAAIFFLISAAVYAQQDDLTQEYHKALAKYFEVSGDAVKDVAKLELSSEDLPVVFYLSRMGKKPAMEIANLRSDGETWMKITRDIGLNAEAYYMVIAGEINSKIYAPIFGVFKESPRRKWADLEFNDSQIKNIVNLKFISSHHDFSAFDVMTMRDEGHNFMKINNMVRLANEEKFRKEKLRKREEARENKETQEAENQ